MHSHAHVGRRERRRRGVRCDGRVRTCCRRRCVAVARARQKNGSARRAGGDFCEARRVCDNAKYRDVEYDDAAH